MKWVVSFTIALSLLNRTLFNKERVEYWKNRAKEIIAKRESTMNQHQMEVPFE